MDPQGDCMIDKNQHVVAQTKNGSRVNNTNFKVEASFEKSDVPAYVRCYMLYRHHRKAYSDYPSGMENV